MHIGIIGSGKIGATAARLFVDAGHDVAIANSRGPKSLTDLAYGELPAEALGNKLVVDAMNYYPERDGHFRELDEDATTSAELLAAHAPDARVVRPLDERLVMFVAGDDQDAKGRVSALIEDIGFAPVDTGSLAEGGRRQQPGSSVYVKQLRPKEARDLLGEPG